ncbi:hypothetical protein [Gracilimonas sp.]|uniref:hypothetical protein n=1 Tax=Gracilimonas sp. TaxID=1974203 RepID=UPI0032EB477E
MSDILQSNYWEAFKQFIFQKEIKIENEFKSSDIKHHIIKLMIAIQANEKAKFDNAFSQIKQRKLDEHVQWIYDDILVFVITVGVLKFNVNKDWINQLFVLRVKNQADDKKNYTETLHFLLNDSNAGQAHLIALCRDLSGTVDKLVDQDVIEAYGIAKEKQSIETEEVERVISEASLQTVIKLKGLDDLEKRRMQIAFINNFFGRSSLIAKVIFWLCFVALILVAIYFSYWFITTIQSMDESWYKTLLEYVVSPMLSFGSIWAILTNKKKLTHSLEVAINKFWGKTSGEKLL